MKKKKSKRSVKGVYVDSCTDNPGLWLKMKTLRGRSIIQLLRKSLGSSPFGIIRMAGSTMYPRINCPGASFERKYVELHAALHICSASAFLLLLSVAYVRNENEGNSKLQRGRGTAGAFSRRTNDDRARGESRSRTMSEFPTKCLRSFGIFCECVRENVAR